MPRTPARSVLDRLRASPRLAAFLLLVFALKLGTAAACVKHDFGQIDAGVAGHPSVAATGPATSNPGPLPGDVGTGTHCQCHHAVGLPLQLDMALASEPPVFASTLALPVRFAERRRNLRPPIA
jgi:hypothetical protein